MLDPQTASALLQYGALGVVALLVVLGFRFSYFIARMFERNVKDLTSAVRDGFKQTNDHIHSARNDVLTAVERDSSRITLPSAKPHH